MDPIKITVNVQIGLTDELHSFLSKLIPAAPAVAAPAAKEPEAQQETKEVAPEPQPEAEVTTQEPAPAEEPKPEPAKEYTEVDVRAAMDRTRKRFEGEDYKDKTDSDLYKKYHRVLTAQFKNMAAVLGSDKPSTLPSSELREAFIKMCDELILGDNGEITTAVPF
jgi:DNA polymerase III gamma/tau subunit